jgi:predicted amidophosphoribosyltransferase
MATSMDLQCPACKARFRTERRCSRCGADLSQPMRVAARAYALRRQARQALCEGRYEKAFEAASEAQELHQTALGRKTMLVAGALDMVSVRRG